MTSQLFVMMPWDPNGQLCHAVAGQLCLNYFQLPSMAVAELIAVLIFIASLVIFILLWRVRGRK